MQGTQKAAPLILALPFLHEIGLWFDMKHIIVLCITLFLISCGDDNSKNYDERIIGTWKIFQDFCIGDEDCSPWLWCVVADASEVEFYIKITNSSFTTYSFDQENGCILTTENYGIEIKNDTIYFDDGREYTFEFKDFPFLYLYNKNDDNCRLGQNFNNIDVLYINDDLSYHDHFEQLLNDCNQQ